MRETRVARWPRLASWTATGIILLTSVTVLIGWLHDISVLKSVLPGWPQMAALTNFSFLFAGIALCCQNLIDPFSQPSGSRKSPAILWTMQICSGIALLIGLLRFCGHLLRQDFGMDQFPFRGTSAQMAPATSLDFVLIGCALLLMRRDRFYHFCQALTLLAALIAWMGFTRYFYGGEPLFPYAQMAVHTSFLFLILSAGLLCLRIDRGLMGLMVSDSAGGVIGRRLLPPALIVPVVVGWLRLQGQRAGWYGTEAGVTLFASSNVVIFFALVWVTAVALDRSDLKRQRAERKTHEQMIRLELLRQITQATGERQDLQSIFQAVLRNLEDNLPIDFGSMCLYDPITKLLTITNIGIRTAALAAIKQSKISIEQNGFVRCLDGQLVYEPDIRNLPAPFLQLLTDAGLSSLVIAPLFVDNRLFGALVVARREAQDFNSSDCEFLKQLSDHVNLAAHQTELYSSLQRAYEDLRSAQHAVMQQQRLRAFGEMAGGIAHDINNSLSPVAYYAESLLETEIQLGMHARSKLETIRRAIGDVSQTLARLRELYRPQAPQASLVPVDLNQLVQQTVELTYARWNTMPRQQGVTIQLVTMLASNLPLVAGIESEIREALVNLIFNASDAMPEGGSLTIRTGVKKARPMRGSTSGTARVYVDVMDSGKGMDEETRRRCMEPFFTTKGERGTGLGLAMVHGVAERHSADIQIESVSGAGTTVRLIFTMLEVVAARSIPSVLADPVVSPQRILLIDDDPLVSETLYEILKLDRHEVAIANGGQEGIDNFYSAQASGKPYTIVITDLGMPYVDGKKVATAVKEVSTDVAVILLTGWGFHLADEDMPAHVDAIVGKPSKIGDLRSAIANCRRSAA